MRSLTKVSRCRARIRLLRAPAVPPQCSIGSLHMGHTNSEQRNPQPRHWSPRYVCTRSFCSSVAAGPSQSSSANSPRPPWWKRVWSLLDREASVAPPGFSRWWGVPGSFLVQLSIGSVYAWSIFNGPLTRELGAVASAAGDWELSSVVPIFSTCALSLGLTTVFLGPWAEAAGPRKVAFCAAMAWSSGLGLTSLGCLWHSLPLVYLGYGVLGGMGWGLGYISPVSNLMKWFPDRRGLATGLALTAFGGGAMVATPVNEGLLNRFFVAPTYVGSPDHVTLITDAGRRFVEIGSELKEVVVASATDVNALPGVHEAGVYLVGTGNSGACMTFATLGATYAAAMTLGAFLQRVPASGWAPEGWTPPPPSAGVTQGNVDSKQVLKTPQFYLMWIAVMGNAIAGVSVISCAKTLMGDVFGAAMPAIVHGGFTAMYVAALSGANMVGRFGWASASDFLGRKNTYYMFGLGIPLAMSLPWITGQVSSSAASLAPLVMFYGSTVLVVSFYGGLFSVLPAYLADIFGQKHVGAIHGRALSAWSFAAVAGPILLSTLRERSYTAAVRDLAKVVDPHVFRHHFGQGLETLDQLMEAKTVTITKLMEIAPPGTVDPTPMLYDSTMYTMSGLLTLAFLCNAAIRPVASKHFIAEPVVPGVGKKAPHVDGTVVKGDVKE